MSWLAAARTRLNLLFGSRAADSRADEEMNFHIEMETERLVREERLPHDAARRRAIVSFGGVTQHKETMRDGHGLAWLGGFSLDMKLGMRMLRKYPGLTIIGGFAMAFAIWAGAVIFQIVGLVLSPSLPLPDGDRIVKIANWDVENFDGDARGHDFHGWRAGLSSVTDLGAYRDLSRNLIRGDGDSRPVVGAEITANAFRIDPSPPLLGRALVPADEHVGAPMVVVLGYDLWRTRFESDSTVIGKQVHLGELPATVVGVMPEGFGFPIAHELWTQLRPELLDRTPRGGAQLNVFGKLASGVSLQTAQTELTTLGRRVAAEFPATHARFQPRVVAYTDDFSPNSLNNLAVAGSIYSFTLLLLVLVCSNVALLIFARAATRESELVVRSALGADRKRIVMQLFAEALVLGGVASVVALVIADFALRTWAVEFIRINMDQVPFWYDLGLSAETILAALGLTVFAAVVAGVLPALKITRGLALQMKHGTAGGGVRFGGVWTAVIVAQVAVTVAFPFVIAVEQGQLRRIKSFDVGFAAEEYLGVKVQLDASGSAAADTGEAVRAAQLARYGVVLEELRQRVAAEPGVAGVTFAERLPRLNHRESYLDVDGLTADTAAEASFMLIDPSYFDVLEAPIIAGRAFVPADAQIADAPAVIVDQQFVDQVLQGRNAVGRRVRLKERPRADGKHYVGPWHEIVGVAKELGMTDAYEQLPLAGIYFPADLMRSGTMHMIVHATGNPLSLGPRIREITAAVNPMLRLSEFQRLDQVADSMLWIIRMWLRASLLLAAITVLLSLAGIYAVLSFTVSRRTREIGVRVALGASRRRLVASIFRRPLTHVTLGVLAGGAIIVFMGSLMSQGDGGMANAVGGATIANIALLLGYMTLMFAVCLLACVVPTRRALKVEPTEALRAE